MIALLCVNQTHILWTSPHLKYIHTYIILFGPPHLKYLHFNHFIKIKHFNLYSLFSVQYIRGPGLLKHVMVSKCEILCLFLCYIKTNIRHPELLISINRFHRCLAENSRISLFSKKWKRTILKPFQATTKFGNRGVTLYW